MEVCFLTHNISCNWYNGLGTDVLLIYGEAPGALSREMACLNCVADQNVLFSQCHVGALASDLWLMRQAKKGKGCEALTTGFKSRQNCPLL